MHLYPILCEPIVKKMIWGQESWDISCRPDEMSIIKNGVYAGMPLDDYFALDREKTLGARLAPLPRFPLLVKIIHARDTLSVQVHPDDAYAHKQSSNDSGKSEMWYILKAPTNGRLVIGLREGITREDMRRAYETGRVEECLHYLNVREGDMVNIPAGLIHALTPGTVVAEIQQNSDTTYRLYDYNRAGPDGNPRELHVEHALAVADFDGRIPKEVTDTVHCAHFTVWKLALEGAGAIEFPSVSGTFHIIICVEGAVDIVYDGGVTRLDTRRSAFIPAGMKASYMPASKERAVVLYCEVPV